MTIIVTAQALQLP